MKITTQMWEQAETVLAAPDAELDREKIAWLLRLASGLLSEQRMTLRWIDVSIEGALSDIDPGCSAFRQLREAQDDIRSSISMLK